MNVGDLVQVNNKTDAGALWGMRGIVTEVLHKHPGRFDDRLLVWVLLPIRLALLPIEAVDVISEDD